MSVTPAIGRGRRLAISAAVVLAVAAAAVVAQAALPSTVSARVKSINTALDQVEKGLESDRLTTAQRKLQEAQRFLKEIQDRYAGKFDAADPGRKAISPGFGPGYYGMDDLYCMVRLLPAVGHAAAARTRDALRAGLPETRQAFLAGQARFVKEPHNLLADAHILGLLQEVAPDALPSERPYRFDWDKLDLYKCARFGPAGAAQSPEALAEAVTWLRQEAHRIIRASRRTMEDGTAAFPPQVGIGYNAFWLRDYEYAVEGSADSFSDKELTDACRLFVRSIREDGAAVDCVAYDGKPIYKPGYGRMGREPVADGPPFTVSVAWQTWRKTNDAALLKEVLDPLVKTMNYLPRNPATGLVHIAKPGDRCPYGFTDTIPKAGDVLFCSLLAVQASRQLGDLLEAGGRTGEARHWREEAGRIAASVRAVFWDEKVGLFRAATLNCTAPDIWGSAFAVYLGVATQEQAAAVARYFKDHYGELVQDGQVRHLPGFMDWNGNRTEANGGTYQSGAFWATPAGWFVYTLDLADPALADRTVLDMVRHFQKHGACEWINGSQCMRPGYLASAALPLDGIRAMLARRAHRAARP